MELREYQREAIDAVYRHLKERDDSPCIVIPTGGGKTAVMATICQDAVTKWGGRVLVIAHVKELLEQTASTLRLMAPDIDIGVYSAGLKRRDTSQPVIVAGIQSIYKRACELDAFDLILVDECHLLPPDGEGMYRQFLTDAKTINPHVRLIGMTATPYRMKSGMLCEPGNLLNHICYEIGVRDLIEQGYLCQLRSKRGGQAMDYSGLHVRAGEFVSSEMSSLMDTDELVGLACREIAKLCTDRRSVLVFCVSVEHAEHVKECLAKLTGDPCELITGKTPSGERAEILSRFKGQNKTIFGETEKLKYLVNVNVLTTGFDAPNVDCIALLRPTASPGLYYQMVGRGFRISPDKDDCLVLDYGGNIMRHGPVDAIVATKRDDGTGAAPAKECPECKEIVAPAIRLCPECGHEFPPPPDEPKQPHEEKASEEGILSGEPTDEEWDVLDIDYAVHTKKGATELTPKTLRVDYKIALNDWQSEWVCIEHDGYARGKAVAWWKKRSPDPMPETAERAVEIAIGGGIAAAKKIVIRSISGEKYDRIIRYELGPIPDPDYLPEVTQDELDDIPF